MSDLLEEYGQRRRPAEEEDVEDEADLLEDEDDEAAELRQRTLVSSPYLFSSTVPLKVQSRLDPACSGVPTECMVVSYTVGLEGGNGCFHCYAWVCFLLAALECFVLAGYCICCISVLMTSKDSLQLCGFGMPGARAKCYFAPGYCATLLVSDVAR